MIDFVPLLCQSNRAATGSQTRAALTTAKGTFAMAERQLPTPDLLRKLLDYDPATGALTWKHRDREFFSDERTARLWNARHAGKPAFTARHSKGYRHGALLGVSLFAHRVAWAITHGQWPSGVIDHINCDPEDNRLENLRDVTPSQNLCNRGKTIANTSGYKGVFLDKRNGKWTAAIKFGGKYRHLGKFSDPEAAHAAYARASKRLHGQYGRTV